MKTKHFQVVLSMLNFSKGGAYTVLQVVKSTSMANAIAQVVQNHCANTSLYPSDVQATEVEDCPAEEKTTAAK
jgi:hypothetical protein